MCVHSIDMVEYIEAKSILSRLKGSDPFFGIGYNMNLYRGCQHACIYCDTRSECYGIGDISTIRVKKNALELLSKELDQKRRNKATIGTGSMNDPYMPVESEIQLTCRALQLIASFKFPVHVITKNALVKRDIDVLQDISKTYAAVSLTITTANDELAQKIEPLASSTSERFEALEQLAKKGIYAGVTLMPLLPFINDTIENISQLFRMAADSGAAYVIAMPGVTMRKGNREYFYNELEKHFSGVKEQYKSYFGDQYFCYSPQYEKITSIFAELSDKYNLPLTMRFYSGPIEKQLSLFE